MRYAIEIKQTEDGYSACSPDVDGCIAIGDTVESVKQEFKSALESHFEVCVEYGDEIGLPQTIVDYVEVEMPNKI